MADADRKPNIKEARTWRALFDEVYAEHGTHDLTWSNDEVDFILWNFTSFPFGSEDDVKGQLISFCQSNLSPSPADLRGAAERFFDEEMSKTYGNDEGAP